MSTFLENAFDQLADLGILDILLPFMLVFTLVFAALQKMKLFGEEKKNINMIIALVMGLLFVVPHVTGDYTDFDPVEIMNSFLPSVSLLLIAVVMFLLILGVFGAETAWGGGIAGWVSIGAFVAVLWIFGASADWWGGGFVVDMLGDDIVSLAVVLIVFALIISFITSDEKKDKEGMKVMRDIGKFFGGK